MNFSDELIASYKESANHSLAKVCQCAAGLMFLIGLLNLTGVFIIKGWRFYGVIALSILIALLPTFVFDVQKKNTAAAQYLVLTSLVLMCGVMYSVLSYHTVIMLAFPIVCACLYGERKWVLYVIIITIPMVILSHIAAFYLKVVPDEPLVTLHGVILYGILPRIIQLTAIGIICIGVTNKLKRLIQSLTEKNDELYENQQTLVSSLSELVETQSRETGLHVKRVREYTRILCEGMGYSREETWKVSIASMMHDVGKLMVPSEIIEKPGRLTEGEFEQIKMHVDYGKRMLEKSPGEVMQLSAMIAYEHHEKWDGSGYKHKKGEEIDPYARCVALADVFDALVSWRPYKKPWTAQEAFNEIISKRGTHFAPEVVDVFIKKFSEFEKVLEQYPDAREEQANRLTDGNSEKTV